VHPEDLPEIKRRFAELTRHPGATDTAEMRCRHTDGSWRWVEATGTNLLDEPSVQAVVVNYRDVSVRKHAEQEHAERLRLDGALLVARTAAHELNNALSPVVGFADLLSSRTAVTGDAEAMQYVERITAAAEEAAEIVRRLQNITRLEADESPLGPGYEILDLEKSTAATLSARES
jgi:signal transduction histidine kinase